jgi:hypothetical protein
MMDRGPRDIGVYRATLRNTCDTAAHSRKFDRAAVTSKSDRSDLPRPSNRGVYWNHPAIFGRGSEAMVVRNARYVSARVSRVFNVRRLCIFVATHAIATSDSAP